MEVAPDILPKQAQLPGILAKRLIQPCHMPGQLLPDGLRLRHAARFPLRTLSGEALCRLLLHEGPHPLPTFLSRDLLPNGTQPGVGGPQRLGERHTLATYSPVCCLPGHMPARLLPWVPALCNHGLQPVALLDEGVHRLRPPSPSSPGKVDPKRFVWLGRHVACYPLPQIALGHGGSVAQRPASLLDVMHGRLGDHGPGGATAPALGDIGLEGGEAGTAARERVDVLARRDALGRVDRQRVSEPQ